MKHRGKEERIGRKNIEFLCNFKKDEIKKTEVKLIHWRSLTSQWHAAAAAAAKSLQSCPTLCDPTDGSPPGSPVPGILQAKTLEWVAISFSNA